MKRILQLMMFVLLAVNLMAQENFPKEDLEGYWLLDKAVFFESSLYEVDSSSEMVYSLQQLAENSNVSNSFINDIVLAIRIFEYSDDPDAYVKTMSRRINYPIVTIENSGRGLLIVDPELKESIYYTIQSISMDQLVLTTGDLFYDKNNIPQKGKLLIYLNRQ